MSTLKQIQANRRNAQRSTGPRTDPGKAAVALNALKHGLYASTLLIPEEDQSQYDALCREQVAWYQPQDLHEIELVEEIVAGRWELIRINQLKRGVCDEARSWATRTDKPAPTAAQIWAKAATPHGSALRQLATISQMEGRVRRRIDRAQRELKKSREERLDQPEPQPQPEPEPQPDPVAEPADPTPSPIPPARAQDPDPAPLLTPGARHKTDLG